MKNRIEMDFGKTGIPALFSRMLYPTLAGMLFSVLFTITDGIFVGRGLGSDALAAVNIAAPLFLISTGFGLMFGMGASVMASINISAGKIRAARINMTHALIASSAIMITATALILAFPESVLTILGCSERLMPLALDYIYGFVPFITFNMLICATGFFVRLDGAPKYAMACAITAASINIILDYLFIFEWGWGMFGAALATGIGTAIGTVMLIAHLCRRRITMRFAGIKFCRRTLTLARRQVAQMCRLGVSSLLSEVAVASMMLCGNYVFIRLTGEDGVAGFSIACYFFPIVYMIYNSIAQSAQPIISFNYGAANMRRVNLCLMLALYTALTCSVVLTSATMLFSRPIVAMFIDRSSPAFEIAANGLPLFAVGFIPFAVNLISIGYFQSIEATATANTITILRGYVLVALSFIVMPMLYGQNGAWLAVPAAEIATLMVLVWRRFAKAAHRPAPNY